MLPNLGNPSRDPRQRFPTTPSYYTPLPIGVAAPLQASLPTLTPPSGAGHGGGMGFAVPLRTTTAGGFRTPPTSNYVPASPYYNEGKYNLSVGGGAGSPTVPGAGNGALTGYAKAHAEVNSKLGEGWSENFQKAHGMSPVDFYTDRRNWFPYQKDAALDYGEDSDQFRSATIRATIEEGMKHQQEAAMWQQLHGNTPIPDEMWQHWYYGNRQGFNGPVVW